MPPGAPGHYFIARLDGQRCGRDRDARRRPVAWNTYIAVDDADATRASLAAAGATVVAEPWDAGPGGRAAVLRDPGGAAFRLWQARRRLGAQAVNVPGTWNFSDLHTADPAAAEAFYGGAVRLGVRLTSAVAMVDVAPPRLRRPPRGDERSGDPRAPGRRVGAARVRRRDRLAGPARRRRGAALARHLRRRRSRRARCHGAGARRPPTSAARSTRRGRRWPSVRDPQGAVFTLSQFTPPG